ncbi:hypothetical protein J7H79_001026 [Enterococcus faecalis]|nr:hypothetical protein [Enterococcus faecalis]
MAYTTEQEAWILCQIQKDRKQKQAERAALRSADLLTDREAGKIQNELDFLSHLEDKNRMHRLIP